MIDRGACAVLALLGLACQGEGRDPVPARRDARSAPIAADAAPVAVVDAPPVEDAAPAERQLEAMGAIPAWQAVIDRDWYLARRGQHGTVYGTVGPALAGADAGKMWLVDDTEGHGALAIKVAWPNGVTPPAKGDRVAVGGAWALDADRRWFWQADGVTPLAPAPPSGIAEPLATPGHAIASGAPPSGWKPVVAAKDDGVITFQVVGPPPVRDGDGWKIANELGDKPAAILTLPGERPSYGAHDLRQPDERWQLKRAVTYWVRIGKVKRRGLDQPALITARTAPVRW